MSSRPAAVIILAAGEGTRMKSETPKVLHRIGGRSLLGHAIAAARHTEPNHVAVVVRHQRDLVVEHVHAVDGGCLIADQDEVKGTGRAAECGLEVLPPQLSGTVLVTYGDVPLLSGQTLLDLVVAHEAQASSVSVLTAHVPDPAGYGRVLRDAEGAVAGVVEDKDASPEQRAITEINSGIYAFEAEVLREALSQVGTDNAQGEKYLTDVVAIARSQGRRVEAHVITDHLQTEGINDRVQLAAIGAEMNRRICERHMRAGVTIVDPSSTWIDAEVSIGSDTTLLPGCQLIGATSIGRHVSIGPDVTLSDSEVADGASIRRAEAHLAVIGPDASVGPFSYLRPGTRLGVGAKVGGFVETKNAQIGDGAKVPHLSYCGDATLKPGANIGAGTIFANFDGMAKHHTTVGQNSFVGSDSVLVAPVEIADGAYVAAGTTLTGDVGAGQIAVGRTRQRNIDGWVQRARPDTATAASARAAADAARGATEPQDHHRHTDRAPRTEGEQEQ